MMKHLVSMSMCVDCSSRRGHQTDVLQWLFDGLRAVFKSHALSSPYDISVEAMIPDEISEFYDRIGESVVTLRHELNTTRGSEGDSDTDEDTIEEASVSSEEEARASVVIDMLSVFDDDKLPDEYESDFPEVTIDSTFEDALIPGNLAATIYGLAVREDSFCVHLRKLINRDVCADYYLAKQRRRAQRAITKLNEPSNDPSMRVYECGDTLRRIVREVCWDREARTSKKPLGPRILNKAAELLVDILELVCKQNRNIATLTSAFSSPGTDANLYTYLISDPPRFEEGDFVIDQLRKFPQNEWRHLLEYLTTIADYVRSNAPETQLRSVRYAENIEAMVNDYTNSAFEPSSSSHRRPTTSGDRESQRRRYI